jgi:hypothetical protein
VDAALHRDKCTAAIWRNDFWLALRVEHGGELIDSPLSRDGIEPLLLIAGQIKANLIAQGCVRLILPCSDSRRGVERLREQARAKGVTVAQMGIAWVLAQGKDIVPLVGARTRERLNESLGALDIDLSVPDLEDIEEAVPAGAAEGTRYNAYLMGELDSEKG